MLEIDSKREEASPRHSHNIVAAIAQWGCQIEQKRRKRRNHLGSINNAISTEKTSSSEIWGRMKCMSRLYPVSRGIEVLAAFPQASCERAARKQFISSLNHAAKTGKPRERSRRGFVHGASCISCHPWCTELLAAIQHVRGATCKFAGR